MGVLWVYLWNAGPGLTGECRYVLCVSFLHGVRDTFVVRVICLYCVYTYVPAMYRNCVRCNSFEGSKQLSGS